MTSYDFWIERDPKIEKTEWRRLVVERSDLLEPSKDFGEVPEDAGSKENLTEFVWWQRSKGLPIKLAFVAGAIHIGAGDTEAWEFASELAAALKGEVNG
jgi:hypothetical protein